MKKGSFMIILGLLLFAAALCLTFYNLADDNRAGAETAQVLEQLTPQIPEDPVPVPDEFAVLESPEEVEYPDYVLNPVMEMPVKEIDGVNYIGIISFPTLDKEFPVTSEWNYDYLRTSPCRFAGSVYTNDMVIFAHNYQSHFGFLKDLSYDDPVVFTDVDGNVFTYKIFETETLYPTEEKQMVTGDWDLTLFTCTIGGATRVTVRCKKAE